MDLKMHLRLPGQRVARGEETEVVDARRHVGPLGPAVVDGEIAIRPIMMVALTYDHRIVDGAEAVQFLVKIKELIEDPERLLLEG